MNERCCQTCVYATRPQGRWHRVMMGRFPGLRVCFNHPDTPGQMQEVRVDGICENYRVRHWPKGKRTRPPKPPNDEIRYIPLTHGLYATVDAQDYESLSKYKWHARLDKRSKNVYAARAHYYRENGKRCCRMIQMHREIMKTPDGMVVDHINGNGINNRRCNMRNCTQFENTHNTRPRTDGKSRFIGVVPHKDKWLARVSTKGRRYQVGTFTDEIEAAKARDRKAVELFGKFARLNFPQEWGIPTDVTSTKGPPPPPTVIPKQGPPLHPCHPERSEGSGPRIGRHLARLNWTNRPEVCTIARMSDAGEVIRKQYLYRRLILSRRLCVSPKSAARLIGPDCAYHLYRSHTASSRSKSGPKSS